MSCCSPEGDRSASETTDAQQATGTSTVHTVYSVTGMTCGHCEKAVGEAVCAVKGVTGVNVDVAAGLVTVVSEGEPDDALIREAVGDAGYDLAGRPEAAAHH